MKKILIRIFALFLFLTVSSALEKNNNFRKMNISQSNKNFVFATYARDYVQVRKAAVLIKSIRDNAGEYSSCQIYIGLPDTNVLNYDILKTEGVTFIYPDLPECARNYYYAEKAYTAAHIEKSLDKNITTLAWFDPETIVFGSVDDLELNKGFSAAVRPVFLFNKIGLLPDAQPDEYWGPLYKHLNLEVENIPIVETEVDLVKTHAYYNCGIFSVNPSLGVMQKWAMVQSVFLKNEEYQREACSDIMRKIFFHQAVFSCVVVSGLMPHQIYTLPIYCGYPLELHSKMPDKKKINKLNNISCAITENLWDNDPNWVKLFTIEEPLKTWLENTYKEYIKTAR